MDNPCFNEPLASEKPGQVNDPNYSSSSTATGFTGVIKTIMTETDLGNNPDAFQHDIHILTSLYKEISKPSSTVNGTVLKEFYYNLFVLIVRYRLLYPSNYRVGFADIDINQSLNSG